MSSSTITNKEPQWPHATPSHEHSPTSVCAASSPATSAGHDATCEKAKAHPWAGNSPAPAFETQASRHMCEHIATQSGGTCILAFSRGKDCVAAWLYLRHFFTRIIPFHLSIIPHLQFADRSLDYYEQYFGTKILRLQDGCTTGDIMALAYQPPGSEHDIDAMNLWYYKKPFVADLVRQHVGIPDAWCAYGISAGDSVMRSWYIGDRAFSEERRTFYPCFDWPRHAILDTIKAAGLKLADDYLLSDRSFNSIINFTALTRMQSLYPEDFETIETYFPLVKALFARNLFRERLTA